MILNFLFKNLVFLLVVPRFDDELLVVECNILDFGPVEADSWIQFVTLIVDVQPKCIHAQIQMRRFFVANFKELN
jgi:hypothetical protein